MRPAWLVLTAVFAAAALAVAAHLVSQALGRDLSLVRVVLTAVVVALFLGLALRPPKKGGFTVED